MTWFDQFATGLGLGGSTTLALGVYGCSVALGRSINPERKTELTHFLTVSADEIKAPNTAKIILSLFEALFGRRHFSWKCIGRSVLVTVLTIIFLTVVTTYKVVGYSETIMVGSRPKHITFSYMLLSHHKGLALFFVLVITVVSIIPDYLSLFKGRLLLRLMSKIASACGIIIIILIDILGSLFVSILGVITTVLTVRSVGHSATLVQILAELYQLISGAFGLIESLFCRRSNPTGIFLIFGFSTLFTSVWTLLVGISLLIVRTILPLRRLAIVSRYLFDVEKSPVEAVGIVVAALVWLCSVAVAIISKP